MMVPLLALAFLGQAWAQTSCDLDNNGATNVVDVSRAVNMALGTLPCTASVEGVLTCSVITVQRVVNAALGQPCVTFNSSTGTYNVTLSWAATTSLQAVGYNVYRRTSPTGTPTKLNATTLSTTSFVDTQPQFGQTYYYSATAVDGAGNESGHSTQAIAVIPAT